MEIMSGNSPFRDIPSRRGKLYVFEGLDRSGKTTVVSSIEGAKKMRFPSGRSSDVCDPISQLISEVLSGHYEIESRALHLLFSADRWRYVTEINDMLDNGINVVIDRYSYSGIAYTIARYMYANDYSENSADELTRLLSWAISSEVGLPKPDVVFFFDADPEILSLRGDYGHNDIHEKVPFQKCVRSAYQLLFSIEGDMPGIDLVFGNTKVVYVDATKSKEEVKSIVTSHIQ